MGKLTDGVFGGFSGRVGGVVGYNIGGEDLLRKRPRKKKDRVPSVKQREQREKFRLVMDFLKPIKGVVGVYFGFRHKAQSRFNIAVGYNLSNAIAVNPEGNFELDYTKVLVTKGDLRGMESGTIEAVAEGTVQLNWTDNSGQGSATADDWVLAIAYSEEQDLFQVFYHVGTRGEGRASITVPAYFRERKLHVWATLVSADDVMPAISSYLGTVTVL